MHAVMLQELQKKSQFISYEIDNFKTSIYEVIIFQSS